MFKFNGSAPVRATANLVATATLVASGTIIKNRPNYLEKIVNYYSAHKKLVDFVANVATIGGTIVGAVYWLLS